MAVPEVPAPVSIPDSKIQQVRAKASADSAAAADATGFEKVIMTIGDSIVKLQKGLDNIFDGKPIASGSRHQNPLDYGILPLLQEVSSIDLCNIFTYLIDKAPKFKPFTPDSVSNKSGAKDKPDVANQNAPKKSLFENSVDFLKNEAYKTQLLIDNFYSSYGNANDPNSKLALTGLIQRVSDSLSLVSQALGEVQGINSNSSQLQSELSNLGIKVKIPNLNIYSNFIDNSTSVFNSYTDLRTVPQKDVQKVIQYVDKVRAVCVAIQGLDSLSSIAQLGDFLLNGEISKDIAKLNKLLNPEKLLPFLKSLQQTCQNIQNICKVLLGFVNKAQSLIRILTLLASYLVKFANLILKILPIPNMYTTAGITNTLSDILQKVLDAANKFIKRLSQLNSILLLIIGFIDEIIIKIDQVLVYIKIMIVNLESCQNADPETTNQLKQIASDLQESRTLLDNFRQNYLKNKSSDNTSYGDKNSSYSIQILTEEVTDPGITLKRRYGVALDKNGAVVVESTPTFASDTSIIIAEVKLLLVSKGFVHSDMMILSSDSIKTINESMNFLQGGTIDLNSNDFLTADTQYVDPSDNENESQGLGLNAFVNKLPGGKRLRKRMKSSMMQMMQNAQPSLNKDKNALATK